MKGCSLGYLGSDRFKKKLSSTGRVKISFVAVSAGGTMGVILFPKTKQNSS